MKDVTYQGPTDEDGTRYTTVRVDGVRFDVGRTVRVTEEQAKAAAALEGHEFSVKKASDDDVPRGDENPAPPDTQNTGGGGPAPNPPEPTNP